MEKHLKERQITELYGRTTNFFKKEIIAKRKLVVERKKELQQIQAKKNKIDLLVTADIENILNKYNITAAAYHGG
jgi:hypothetical protein